MYRIFEGSGQVGFSEAVAWIGIRTYILDNNPTDQPHFWKDADQQKRPHVQVALSAQTGTRCSSQHHAQHSGSQNINQGAKQGAEMDPQRSADQFYSSGGGGKTEGAGAIRYGEAKEGQFGDHCDIGGQLRRNSV